MKIKIIILFFFLKKNKINHLTISFFINNPLSNFDSFLIFYLFLFILGSIK
jgi:hypothetical protein